MRPIVSWSPISFASSVAFDTVVLLLTLAKIHTNLSVTSSQVGRQIYQDNLMYFIISTVTNIVVLAIESLGAEHTMIKPTAVPFSTLMTVTMGSRVYLNLKLIHTRSDQRADYPIPPSFGSGIYRGARASIPPPVPSKSIVGEPLEMHASSDSLFTRTKEDHTHQDGVMV